jgi:phosphate/sulfate permease
VAIAIGSVAYGLLLIPIAGSIIAPILGGVAATLVMYEIKEPVFKTSEREREPEQAPKVSDPDTPEG